VFQSEHSSDFALVFQLEHCGKGLFFVHTCNTFIVRRLGISADIPAASVVKKGRWNRALETGSGRRRVLVRMGLALILAANLRG